MLITSILGIGWDRIMHPTDYTLKWFLISISEQNNWYITRIVLLTWGEYKAHVTRRRVSRCKFT